MMDAVAVLLLPTPSLYLCFCREWKHSYLTFRFTLSHYDALRRSTDTRNNASLHRTSAYKWRNTSSLPEGF